MAEQEQNRSESATPHKLREAQKRGQTAKSQEATFAAILAALIAALFAVGASIAHVQLMLAGSLFGQAGRSDWQVSSVMAWLGDVLRASLQGIVPLFIVVAVAAILANLAQVGAIFSADPVTPDFQRLNPAAGFKKLFSMRVVYEAFKSVAKLAVIATVLGLALRQLLPHLMSLIHVHPRAVAGQVMGEVGPLLFKLLLALTVLALIDMVYTRRDFAKKMRMSRREVSDEHKQREGDPRIRSRLRQIRMELLKQTRSLGQVPNADVLLTNPTHVAVAISYKHGTMPAPTLLAKGAGELAARMRETARRHHIPVVENRALARALYKRIGPDQYVPEDLYPAVAKILIWVYALRAGRGATGEQA